MIDPVYRYRASVYRVKDGDTYEMTIDLGFKASIRVPVRIRDFDAPELPTPEGLSATDAANKILSTPGAVIIVETYKDHRSFERWIADVYVNGQNIGELLLAQGLARRVHV